MPAWLIPLLTSAFASGAVAAGTQLGLGGGWKAALGAFLTGALTGAGLHAAPSPVRKP